MNIPIYDGTCGAISQSTPFGFYDNDVMYQNNAPGIVKWCATRLGYPILSIEMQTGSFFACFEEAITEYSAQVNQFNILDNLVSIQGSKVSTDFTQNLIYGNLNRVIGITQNYGTELGVGGLTSWRTGSLSLIAGQQDYDLNQWATSAGITGSIEIRRIYHYPPPAIVRYFDPFVGTGMGTQQMLDNFGWGNYSPGVNFTMMPIYGDLLRLQAIEFNDQIRKSGYSFELINNQLRIFPIPDANLFNGNAVWFNYTMVDDRYASSSLMLSPNHDRVSDYSNAQYNNITFSNINDVGKQWVRQYTFALSMETLGYIRGKYATVPIPGETTTLNGPELVSAGKELKIALLQHLRENLEKTSRKVLLANESEIAASVQNTIKQSPLPIYIA